MDSDAEGVPSEFFDYFKVFNICQPLKCNYTYVQFVAYLALWYRFCAFKAS